jgi:hypothetical protein
LVGTTIGAATLLVGATDHKVEAHGSAVVISSAPSPVPTTETTTPTSNTVVLPGGTTNLAAPIPIPSVIRRLPISSPIISDAPTEENSDKRKIKVVTKKVPQSSPTTLPPSSVPLPITAEYSQQHLLNALIEANAIYAYYIDIGAPSELLLSSSLRNQVRATIDNLMMRCATTGNLQVSAPIPSLPLPSLVSTTLDVLTVPTSSITVPIISPTRTLSTSMSPQSPPPIPLPSTISRKGVAVSTALSIEQCTNLEIEVRSIFTQAQEVVTNCLEINCWRRFRASDTFKTLIQGLRGFSHDGRLGAPLHQSPATPARYGRGIQQHQLHHYPHHGGDGIAENGDDAKPYQIVHPHRAPIAVAPLPSSGVDDDDKLPTPLAFGPQSQGGSTGTYSGDINSPNNSNPPPPSTGGCDPKDKITATRGAGIGSDDVVAVNAGRRLSAPLTSSNSRHSHSHSGGGGQQKISLTGAHTQSMGAAPQQQHAFIVEGSIINGVPSLISSETNSLGFGDGHMHQHEKQRQQQQRQQHGHDEDEESNGHRSHPHAPAMHHSIDPLSPLARSSYPSFNRAYSQSSLPLAAFEDPNPRPPRRTALAMMLHGHADDTSIPTPIPIAPS